MITFSPHPCHGACFYNVIEQGTTASPASSRWRPAFSASSTPRCGSIPIVNDSRNTVYSNYFLATPRFWSAWDRIFSRLFDLAETPGSALREALNRPVVYAKDDGAAKPAQMKIMLMERVVSLLLASRAFKIKNYPPFSMPLSAPFVGRLPELVALDELKIAYAESGDQQLLRQFAERRDKLVALAWAGGQATL